MIPSLESAWTTARPDCPRPEWWHAHDSDSTEIEVTELVAAFVRATQPEFVVETGTAYGQTAHAIGQALARNGHGELLTLEPDPDRAAAATTRCAGLPVTVMQKTSMEWEPDRPIGFAWLDSLFELRIAEFMRFAPWIAPGTIVGFHDAGPHRQFRVFLEAMAGAGVVRLIMPRTPRGVCFAEMLTVR